MLRIIAGTKKGKTLNVVDEVTKPLTDRIKTSIFDIIKDYIPKSRVLDLFSGSGNFAIEALSRGASHATLVEFDSNAIDIIKGNLHSTGLSNNSEVKKQNVFIFLKRKPEANSEFDIIFLDPPFPFTKKEKTELLKQSSKFLNTKNPDSLLIFRFPEKEMYSSSKLTEVYSKKYGISKVNFYRKIAVK